MPIFFLVNELVSSSGLLEADIQFQPSLSVTKDIFIKHELVAMPADEFKPEKGKLYLTKDKDKAEFKYIVLDPTGNKVDGVITSEDILYRKWDKPFDIEAIKPHLDEILDVTAHRGHTPLTRVTTSHAAKGSFLLSDGFGPCQAVVARLKNGEFAIYHAANFLRSTDGFIKLVEEIKDQVKDIYVFQKSTPVANLKKGPLLVLELADVLNMEVKRINVEHYTAVLADAKTNKLILIGNIKYLNSKEMHVDDKQNGFEIDVKDSAIPMSKTILDAMKFQQTHTEVGYCIPKQFLPLEVDDKKVEKPKLDLSEVKEDRELVELKNEIKIHLDRLTNIKGTDHIKYAFSEVSASQKKLGLALCLKYLDHPDFDAFQRELGPMKNYSKSGKGETAKLLLKASDFIKKMSKVSLAPKVN